MNETEPALKEKLSKARKSFPFWYLAFVLLLVWMWQAAIGQYAVRTIPYSEFKDHLKKREVAECVVRQGAVEGRIQPKATVESGASDPADATATKKDAAAAAKS